MYLYVFSLQLSSWQMNTVETCFVSFCDFVFTGATHDCISVHHNVRRLVLTVQLDLLVCDGGKMNVKKKKTRQKNALILSVALFCCAHFKEFKSKIINVAAETVCLILTSLK